MTLVYSISLYVLPLALFKCSACKCVCMFGVLNVYVCLSVCCAITKHKHIDPATGITGENIYISYSYHLFLI